MIKIITYKIKYFFILLAANQLLLSRMVQIYNIVLGKESVICYLIFYIFNATIYLYYVTMKEIIPTHNIFREVCITMNFFNRKIKIKINYCTLL